MIIGRSAARSRGTPDRSLAHCVRRYESTVIYRSHPPTQQNSAARRRRLIMAQTADESSDISSRPQQSPLASRRAQETDTSKRQSRLDGLFPLSFKEGFSQWWGAPPATETEHRVLSHIPYLQKPPTHTQTASEPLSVNPNTMNVSHAASDKATPVTTSSATDPWGPRTWRSQMVELPGKNRALNEFSVERVGEKTENNLVMLHGYGAGLGFYYKNFEPLSRPKGWQLYALDMLGMGRSSRPPFKIHAKSREDQIREAEDWFVDSLEQWRIKKNIDKFTLCGHSMGGYMAVCYALKYPGRLNKLILASPVGIPEDPYAVNADMPEPPASGLANEFTQDQETESRQAHDADQNNFLNARSKFDKDEQQQAANPNRLPTNKNGQPPRKPLPKWLTTLWDANVSPFSLVRWSGPFGPRLVSGWTSRRFSHLPPDEALALHDYSYSLFRLRGSGEYVLAYILAPGAFARSPLIKRIGEVGRGRIEQPISASAPGEPLTMQAQTVAETGVPVVLMYGENDWMDVKGGYAARELLDRRRQEVLQNATDEQKKAERGSAKVVIIKKAGHHVYLDNPELFNKVMLDEMADTAKKA